MEIDSVERAMTILEQIIEATIEAEDFLNPSQLQDKSGMYTKQIKQKEIF